MGDRLRQDVRDPHQLVVGDDEWRPEQDRVAVGPVGVARPGIDEDPAPAGGAYDRLGEPRGPRVGPARFALGDELQPDHQSATTHLPDRWVIP